MNLQDNNGQTAYHASIINKFEKITIYLKEKGIDTNIKDNNKKIGDEYIKRGFCNIF